MIKSTFSEDTDSGSEKSISTRPLGAVSETGIVENVIFDREKMMMVMAEGTSTECLGLCSASPPETTNRVVHWRAKREHDDTANTR